MASPYRLERNNRCGSFARRRFSSAGHVSGRPDSDRPCRASWRVLRGGSIPAGHRCSTIEREGDIGQDGEHEKTRVATGPVTTSGRGKATAKEAP